MSHTTAWNPQENVTLRYSSSRDTNKRVQSEATNHKIVNKRKSCAERNHRRWLRRVHKLIFPEEYRESLLYQLPSWEEVMDNTEQKENDSMQEELLQLLHQINQRRVEEFKSRWNFDPVTHTPLEGRWKWTGLSEEL